MIRLFAIAVMLYGAGSASAFYFPGWPGATRAPAPILIPTEFPNVEPTVTPPEQPEEPVNTPEPSTMLLASIGCAFVMRRIQRGRRSDKLENSCHN